MNYSNVAEKAKLEGPTTPAPAEGLTEMMKEASIIAADVLAMSRRINACLFGIGNPCCEKEADPECFRDALAKTRCELMATAEELGKICVALGM